MNENREKEKKRILKRHETNTEYMDFWFVCCAILQHSRFKLMLMPLAVTQPNYHLLPSMFI